jgi:hypothetical protein
MKASHVLLPLLAMASMGFVFEKRERDAATAELRKAAGAFEMNGPILRVPLPSHSQVRAQKELTAVEMRDRYEQAFAEQKADAAWANTAERVAGDRLKVTVPEGSTVRAIKCRESMCRIETSHIDASTSEKFIWSSFMTPSTSVWNAPVFSTLLEPAADNKPLLLVSYLARQGRSLPVVY